jgi:AraC-like DNA-binding protein
VKNSENTDDQRHLNGNKNSLNPSSHFLCAAAVEEKCRLIIEALATTNGMSVSTFHAVFHEDLGLEKKPA